VEINSITKARLRRHYTGGHPVLNSCRAVRPQTLCAGCRSFKLLCLTARRGGLNPHLSSGSNRIAWSLLVNDGMMLERSKDEITKLAVFYRAPGSLRRLIGKW